MAKTIFDHLKGITKDKVQWDALSDGDKASWDDFMVTRWLSMKPEYVEFLNELQVYRNAGLQGEQYYKVLFYSLPKETSYYKYVKKPKTFETNKSLLQLFSSIYKVSYRECLDIIKIFRTLQLSEKFDEILSKRGLQEDEKEKLRKEMFND